MTVTTTRLVQGFCLDRHPWIEALRQAAPGAARRVMERPQIRQLCPAHRHLVERLLAGDADPAPQDTAIDGVDDEGVLIGHYVALPRDLRGHPGMGIRFDVDFASPRLLRFLGKSSYGFRVLGISCAGLEYHWRSDLVRALEERVAHAGRLTIITEAGSRIELEHLVLPKVENGRVVAMRGWFAYCSHVPARMPLRWDEVSIVRRHQRAHPVPLPVKLLCNRAGAAPAQEMLCALKTSWREARETPEAARIAAEPGVITTPASGPAAAQGRPRRWKLGALGVRAALSRWSSRAEAKKEAEQ